MGAVKRGVLMFVCRCSIAVLGAALFCQALIGAGEPGASQATGAGKRATVIRAPFGTADGRAVEMFTLTNANGVEIRAITYGGIITSIAAGDNNIGLQ